MSGRFTRVIQPWTCRTCLHQQRQQVQQRQQQFRQGFSQRAGIGSNWSRGTTAGRAGRINSGVVSSVAKDVPRGGRRKRILWAAVGTAGGGLAFVTAFGDDAKYFGQATQRSARVVSTLAVCINEYGGPLPPPYPFANILCAACLILSAKNYPIFGHTSG